MLRKGSTQTAFDVFKQATGQLLGRAADPAGTPRSMVDRLQAEIGRLLTEPEFAARLKGPGLTAIGGTPEQFAMILRAEQDKWARLVHERRLSLE